MTDNTLTLIKLLINILKQSLQLLFSLDILKRLYCLVVGEAQLDSVADHKLTLLGLLIHARILHYLLFKQCVECVLHRYLGTLVEHILNLALALEAVEGI